MGDLLNNFITPKLSEKLETRQFLKITDFFELLDNMGITEDDALTYDICEFLESNNITIDFNTINGQSDELKFRRINNKFKLFQKLKIDSKKIIEIINLSENIPRGIQKEEISEFIIEEEPLIETQTEHFNVYFSDNITGVITMDDGYNIISPIK